MKTNLSTHFRRYEFACKCGCGYNTVDAELLTVLQWLRWETNSKITVLSGCRCPMHNKRVGGAKRSKHLLGRAADIVVEDYKPSEIYHLIDTRYPDQLGLIQYDSFIHVDSRDGKYRHKN